MKSYTKMHSNIGGYIGTMIHPKDGKIVGKIIDGSIGAYCDYLAGNSKLIAEWMVESAKEIRKHSCIPNDFFNLYAQITEPDRILYLIID